MSAAAATIPDAQGAPIAEGSRVRVLALPAGFLDGLEPEDAAFVARAVGMTGEVDEILGEAEASLMLREGGGIWHVLRLPGRLMEAVAEDGAA